MEKRKTPRIGIDQAHSCGGVKRADGAKAH